ncbi:MAG: hypothetical protein L6R40_002035 [Gallowayella cf. fulva]|nr:MAG: hypothetical protein L6R40_002035 [Xanthomendoza cf. fulva]
MSASSTSSSPGSIGRHLKSPTTSDEFHHRIALQTFAIHVGVEQLANHCLTQIHRYQHLTRSIAVEDVKCLYDHGAGVALRVLFVLELVLQARAIRANGPVNPRISPLYRRGVRGHLFRHDFDILKDYCARNRINWASGRAFLSNFSCVFHTHQHTNVCNIAISVRNAVTARKIRGAFEVLHG